MRKLYNSPGTVVILKEFTGYPGGVKTKFKAGDEPDLLPAFANMIVEKGHAKWMPNRNQIGRPKTTDKENPDDE